MEKSAARGATRGERRGQAESRRRVRAKNRQMARSERFELPALGIEIRCSIQLSYERVRGTIQGEAANASPGRRRKTELPHVFQRGGPGSTGRRSLQNSAALQCLTICQHSNARVLPSGAMPPGLVISDCQLTVPPIHASFPARFGAACASGLACAGGFARHPRSRRLCRGIQGEIRADQGPPRARHHRRHLQFGLHAGAGHRAQQQDLRDPARQSGLPSGLLRQGLHLRHQDHQLRGDRRT